MSKWLQQLFCVHEYRLVRNVKPHDKFRLVCLNCSNVIEKEFK